MPLGAFVEVPEEKNVPVICLNKYCYYLSNILYYIGTVVSGTYIVPVGIYGHRLVEVSQTSHVKKCYKSIYAMGLIRRRGMHKY